MRTSWVALSVLAACATGDQVQADPSEVDPEGKADGGRITVPDVRCAGQPAAGPTRSFRHFKSRLIAGLGSPKHRGFDLIASASSAVQVLEGWISYTLVDKALEDEDVDLFACRAGQWQRVGTARTDDEGYFALRLSTANRLPIGMRDLFVSVAGDRTGIAFLAYVAPAGTQLIASDVDGTLTSSENAFIETIVLGNEPGARAGAAQAFTAATARGYQMVYVTARGNQYTTATRDWLAHKGFPRGPVRLASSFLTLPGGDTIDYKTSTFEALAASGLDLTAGVGNRASDVAAYGNVGIAPDRIFIELPEYVGEVQPLLDLGAAIGFASYDELRTGPISKLP